MSIPANISNIKQFVFPQIQCADGSTIQLRLNKGASLGYDLMSGSLSASLSGSQVCYLKAPHELVEVGSYQLVKHDVDGDLAVPQINFKINDSFLLNGILGNSSGGVTGGTPIQYDFSNYSSSADNTSFLDTVFSDTSTSAEYEVYWSRSSTQVPLEIWFWGNVDVSNFPKEVKLVEYPNTVNTVYQNEWQFTAVSWINQFSTKKVSDLITRVAGWNGISGTGAAFSPIATDARNVPAYIGQSNWVVPPHYTTVSFEPFNDVMSPIYTPAGVPAHSYSAAVQAGYFSYNVSKQAFGPNDSPPQALSYYDPDIAVASSSSASYPNIVCEMTIADLAKQTACVVEGVDPSNIIIDPNMMFDLYAQTYSATGSDKGWKLHSLSASWSEVSVLQNFLFGFSIGADQSLSGSTVPYLTSFPNSLPYNDPLTTPLKWVCTQTGTFVVPRIKTVSGAPVPIIDFIGRRTKFTELPTNWVLAESSEEPNTFDCSSIIVQNLADDLQIQAGSDNSNVKTIIVPWRAHKFGPRYTTKDQNFLGVNDAPDNLWYWFDRNLGFYQPLAVTFNKKIDQQPSNDTPPIDNYWADDSLTGIASNKEYKVTDKGWVGSTIMLWKSNSSTGVPSITKPHDIYHPNTIPYKTDDRWNATFDNYYSVAAILPKGVSLPSDEHLTTPGAGMGYFCPLIAYAEFYYQELVGNKITLTQTYQGCTDDNGYIFNIVPGMHKQEFIHNKLRDFSAHEIEIDPINCVTKVKWIEQFYNADGTPNGNAYEVPELSEVKGGGGSSNSSGGSVGATVVTNSNITGLYIQKFPKDTNANVLQPAASNTVGISFYQNDNVTNFENYYASSSATVASISADGSYVTTGKIGAGTLNPKTTVDVYGDFSYDNQLAIALLAGQNNDLAIGKHSNIYILAGSDAQISGFDTPQNGKVVNVYFDLDPTRIVTLQHENTGSLVPNRLHLETLSNYSITGQAYATFIYDQNEVRWIPQSIIQGASLTGHLRLAGSPYFIDDTGTPTRSSVVVGGTGTSKDAIAIGAGATASKTSAIAIGWNSTASGNYSFAVNNVDQPNGAFASNSISIGKDNLVDSASLGGVVVGGVGNKVLGSVSAGVYAGSANIVTAASDGSVIVGGTINTINDSRYSVIDGGLSGVIYASDNSVIGAGELNSLSSSTFSAILGGLSNTVVNTAKSAILGGELNSLSGSLRSEILGGYNNAINGAGHFEDNIIAGGENQTITSTSGAFIGTSNTSIITNSNEAAILGGSHNSVTGSPFASVFGSTGSAIYSAPKSIVLGGDNVTILNGYESAAFNSTSASINSSTGSVIIATGSAGNGVGSISGAINSFIIGGYGHSITNDGALRSIGSAIIGGVGHSISGSNDAIMLGGLGNRMVDSDQGTIIGSEHCFIDATTRGHITNSLSSTVNTNTYYSNILGGQQNILGGAATIHGSNMLGGQSNTAWSEFSTVAGLGNLVNGYAETRLGYFGKQELSQSPTATAALDLLFAIGNGTGPGSLSDAFRVDNGGRVSATSFTGSVSYFTSKNIDANGIGTTTNNIGSTYADNTVIAWCELSYSNGGSTVLSPAPVTMNSSFNISNPPTVAGVGSITLTLLSGLPTDVVIQATAKNIATPAPFIVNATYGGGVITIDTFNAAGALANAAGVFITIFGRK